MLKKIRRLCRKINYLLIVFALLGAFFPSNKVSAASASLYLSPAAGTYVIGGSFSVSVRVNSGGDGVNAAEGVINYDSDLLEATAVTGAGSIFPFWTTQPSISGGAVRFGGGLPPPAYTGTAGHIVKITFKAKKAGQASVRFASGAVLANDGKGTNILASMSGGNYTISPAVETPKTDTSKPAQIAEPKVQKEPEPEYNKPLIKSSTHPDQEKWYNKNKIKFEWELPAGVTGVSLSLDQKPDSDPGSLSDGSENYKEYEDVKDGIWYFHLKFRDSKRWGTAAHYKVMIDTEPPLPFEIKVDFPGIGEWPILKFETTDKGSGLEKYLIFVNSADEQYFELSPDKNEIIFSDLEIGKYLALVKAVDRAGNERIAASDISIDPIDTPVIKNYPEEIRPGDSFYISGTALPNVEITVFLEKPGSRFVPKITQSDANGNWFYIFEDKMQEGRYTAWVKAQNKNGISSVDSEKVSLLVAPPAFTVIGSFVINYFTVMVSLIFMIFLTIALGLYVFGIIKKRLRKEAFEIETVLHENLKAYQEEFDKEFLRLSKYEGKPNYKKEKAVSKEILKNKIDLVEKKILKEVRDVEKIVE